MCLSRHMVTMVMVLAACLLIRLPAFGDGKTLVIAGDEEKIGHYVTEITQTAFNRAGYEVEFKFVPWVRALNMSAHGFYDVLLAAYYTDERAEKFLYSMPIGKSEVFLFKKKGTPIAFKRLEELKPYRIGHIRGATVSSEFDRAEKQFLTLEYVTDTEMNIRKLLAGRIDLVVEKKQRIDHLLNTVFKDVAGQVEQVHPRLKINYFYNCVSKRHPQYKKIIKDFNQGLTLIKEDGTLEEICRRFGIEDF